MSISPVANAFQNEFQSVLSRQLDCLVDQEERYMQELGFCERQLAEMYESAQDMMWEAEVIRGLMHPEERKHQRFNLSKRMFQWQCNVRDWKILCASQT